MRSFINCPYLQIYACKSLEHGFANMLIQVPENMTLRELWNMTEGNRFHWPVTPLNLKYVSFLSVPKLEIYFKF